MGPVKFCQKPSDKIVIMKFYFLASPPFWQNITFILKMSCAYTNLFSETTHI